MSLGKAILGGILLGKPGFLFGLMMDGKETVNVNVVPTTAKTVEKTIEDEFYDKLNDLEFESFVYDFCREERCDIDDLNKHMMKNLMFNYDEWKDTENA